MPAAARALPSQFNSQAVIGNLEFRVDRQNACRHRPRASNRRIFERLLQSGDGLEMREDGFAVSGERHHVRFGKVGLIAEIARLLVLKRAQPHG